MMKKFIKVITVAVLVFIVIFICFAVFIKLKGKDLVTSRLEQALGRNVEFASISASFPLGIKITKVDIEGLLKVDEIQASFSVIDLLKRNIELPILRIVKPQLIIKKTPDGFDIIRTAQNISNPENYRRNIIRFNSLAFAQDSNKQVEAKKEIPVNIFINRLIIQDGKVKYIDETLGADIFQIDLINIDVKAGNIYYPPKPARLEFDISADAVDGTDSEYGNIKASGWIDLVKKDMLGEIRVANLDGTFFYPYYKKFSSRMLKSANVNFNSDLDAKDNDLIADCHLHIDDFLFEEPKDIEALGQNISDILIGSLVTESEDFEFNFKVRTKLDNPKFNTAQIPGMVFGAALQKAVAQPPEKTIEDFKDMGEKIKDIGKELEGTFKGLFKKE